MYTYQLISYRLNNKYMSEPQLVACMPRSNVPQDDDPTDDFLTP